MPQNRRYTTISNPNQHCKTSMPKMASLPETAGPPELPGALHHRRLRRRGVSRQQRRVRRHWRQLYKNRSSRKTDSQQEKRSSGSHILSKIVSENRFSGKTYSLQLVPGDDIAALNSDGESGVVGLSAASVNVGRFVGWNINATDFSYKHVNSVLDIWSKVLSW